MFKNNFLIILIIAVIFIFSIYSNTKIDIIWNYFLSNYLEIKIWSSKNLFFSIIAFSIIYILTTSLSLPFSLILTLIYASILGWTSLPLIIFSASSGAFILFLISKNMFQTYFQKKVSNYLVKAKNSFNRSPFMWLLFLRLLPIMPFWACNVLPGLLKMNNKDFLKATIIGITPGTSLYVWLGVGFEKYMHKSDSGYLPNINIGLLIPLFIISFLVLLSIFIKRKN